MGYRLLADGILLLHPVFIGFVIAGALLCWRWPCLSPWHLPMLGWSVYIEVSGGRCPLTPLEKELRTRAGRQGY